MTLLLMAAGSGSRYGKLKQFDELGPQGEFLWNLAFLMRYKTGLNILLLLPKPLIRNS